MSGFGARARQAEYEAATNAKQRQVSREAEEQKLPPKPVPVSLGAFTRAPQPSRNKGNKAWKPLTLDDIGEDFDDQVQQVTEESGSSTTLSTRREDVSPMRHQTQILLRDQSQVINVNIPAIAISAGPRPQRVLNDPIVNFPQYHGGFSYPSFQAYAYPSPMYAYSNFAGSPQVALHGIPSEPEWQGPRPFVAVMAPSDISPTRQEDKLAMLSKVPEVNQYENYPQQTTYYPPYVEMGRPSQQTDLGSGDLYPQNRIDSGNDGGFTQYGFLQHEPVPTAAVEPDRLLKPTSVNYLAPSSRDHATMQTPVRSISFKVPDIVGPTSALPQDRPSTSKSGSAPQESYDRRSEMQSYITTSTQKAMARTTKTVLNNPELRKETVQPERIFDTNVSNPILRQNSQPLQISELKLGTRRFPTTPWSALAPAQSQKAVISKLNLSSRLTPRESEGMARAINNPAPGLALSDVDGCKEAQGKRAQPDSMAEELHEIPASLFDEWCEPVAPTRASRQHIRNLMAKAAAKIAGRHPQPLLDVHKAACQSEVSDSLAEIWFQEDKRGVRIAAIDAARQKAQKPREELLLRSGGRLSDDLYDGFTTNLLVNEVSLNVRSYRDRQCWISEQQRSFFKVKPVPEFAIEKAGMFASCPQVLSYFDDNQEGFGTAPVRIARDPRFRPHGKDGSKIKLEEEWKHRHEMYGRKGSEIWNM